MNDPAIITIIFIIAFTALLLSIKTFIDLQKLKKETEKQSEDTADDIQALRKKIVSIQTDCDSTDKIKVIEERLNKLERPMRIAASVSGENSSFSFAPKPVAPQLPKDGYFGAPKGDAESALFNDQYDELRDECFFSVHYLSTTEAEFEPIDLMRLKSLPAIEGVIRYDGCPLKEARGFQLKSKGKVKKQNNYWVVTARAELQMQK